MNASPIVVQNPDAYADCWSRWQYMIATGEGSFTVDEWAELAAMAAKLAPADVPHILDQRDTCYPVGSTGVYDDAPWGCDEPNEAEIMALEERMGWAR